MRNQSFLYGFLCSAATAALLTGGASRLSAQVYVANNGDGTIRKFSANGIDQGNFASGLGSLFDVKVAANGNVYASNFNSIHAFAPDGTSLGQFGSNAATSIVFDSLGNLYASSRSGNTNTVEKLSSTGLDLGTFTSYTGSRGIQFMATDAAKNLYLAESSGGGDGLVEKFSPTGVDLGVFVPNSAVPNARGLAFDHAGNLYVSNLNSNSASGNYVREFSSSGQDLGTFVTTPQFVNEIAFDNQGDLLAAIDGFPGPGTVHS